MQLKALEDLSSKAKELELKLADELHIFFGYLERKILKNVDLENPLEAIFYQQVNTVVQDNWKEYNKIIMYYADKAAMLSLGYYDLMKAASIKHSLDYSYVTKSQFNMDHLNASLGWYLEEQLVHFNPQVYDQLETYEFKASEKTMARVTREINNILSEGYYTEKGHYHIRDMIQEKFTRLKTYEAMRIAQTEVNAARNYTQFAALIDDGMEYIIWNSANDARVRDSHKDHPIGVGNTIIPIGERFSNGLMYPADREGTPLKEWINCRCSHSAYIIPLGYTAPNFFPFTEKDLIKIDATPTNVYDVDYYPAAVLPREGYDFNGHEILKPKDIIKMIDLPRDEAFQEIAEYHDAHYLGIDHKDELGNEYYTFVQEYEDGKHMYIYFSVNAADLFEKQGWTHPIQILDEVFKVPNSLKKDTREIWFKDSLDGLHWDPKKKEYDKLEDESIDRHWAGYNWGGTLKYRHKIVISPKYFTNIDGSNYHDRQQYDYITHWIKTIHHEFGHTIDLPDEVIDEEIIKDGSDAYKNRLSLTRLYANIHREEPTFTWYADTEIVESFAEHCGYVSMMLTDPTMQHRKIRVKFTLAGEVVEESITFDEYKKIYPKHYAYFSKLLTGSIPANNKLWKNRRKSR